MEGARDLALEMANRGEGKLSISSIILIIPTPITPPPGRNLAANWRAHYPFCLQHGNNRTITGVSRFMREQSKPVTIVGCSRKRAVAFPAFAAGLRNISGDFQRFSGG